MKNGSAKFLTEPRFLVGIVCVLSVALGFSLGAGYVHPVKAAPAAPNAISGDWRTAFVDIAEQLRPCVVKITSEKTVETSSIMPQLDDFFPPFNIPRRAQPEKRTQSATGSGVIVRPDGYILTNNHVVQGADRVTVQLADGRELKGKVMLDPRTDLALVKVEATGLAAAKLADSDRVKVGQWAIAIGSPFGLKSTVTVGVISAFRKELGESPIAAPVIQTDASINPGNSGGPLVNIDGEVVGINFLIVSRTGGNEGIGFAIPSNTAKFVMEQLIKHGKVVRGYLGIDLGDLSPALSQALGAASGAVVQNVYKDSPAEKAGLQVKDVIVKVDGRPVENGADLRAAIQETSPGTAVKLLVIRNKKERTVSVKLDTLSEENVAEGGESEDRIGLSVQPLTPELAEEIGVPGDIKGVVVRSVEAGTPAARAGIRAKDVITEIDDQPVTSVASFSRAVKQIKSGEVAIVVVQRGERSLILEMTKD